jgi:ADP-ribose pyrophosphatase
MEIRNVRRLTNRKWLNLFEATYQHGDHQGRWLFASRKADPTAERGRPDAVLVVPIVRVRRQPPRLLLIREFRVPVGDYVYGFPAGLLEEGESAADTARRELLEETGFEVTKVKHVSPPLYSSCGMTDESAVMVYVDCRPTAEAAQHLDPSEEIEVVLADFNAIRRLCDDPGRVDTKVWTTLYMYCQLGELR